MGRLIAAADIGSNTAHLLIAEVSDTGLKRVVNVSEWLSLGLHVRQYGEIKQGKRKELLEVMKKFQAQLIECGVTESFVFATEAMRRARNYAEIIKEIKAKTGLIVKIISPNEEAELSVLASQVDTPGSDPTLMVEIGGGSVQVAYCIEGVIIKEMDLQLGTGVLLHESELSFPTSEEQMRNLLRAVQDRCHSLADFPNVARIVSCGGVARGIWRALHPDGAREVFAEELNYLVWSVKRLEHSAIVERFNVKLKRAETLLPGALIFLEIMSLFGLGSMTVSKFGVREGAILRLASESGVEL